MSEDYKKHVREINAEFRNAEIQQLENNLPHILETLDELHDSYESSSKIEKYKLIHEHIYELSFYDKNSVEAILTKYKLNEILPKLFKDSRILFEELFKHEQLSNHIFLLNEIYIMYKDYSKLIIKKQLALLLGFDLMKVGEKINSQHRNNNTPKLLNEQTDDLSKLKTLSDSEGVKFHFKENTPIHLLFIILIFHTK